MADIIGIDGKRLDSTKTHDENGVKLTMPWIVSITITGVIQARNEEEAKRGLHNKVSVSMPMVPHLLSMEMDANPMPPEMVAEMLANQQKGKQ